jgi:hypothetical protein
LPEERWRLAHLRLKAKAVAQVEDRNEWLEDEDSTVA